MRVWARRQHQHRCSSIFVCFFQRCCCCYCCSGGKQEIRKGYDGLLWGWHPGPHGIRAVLKSRITSLSSRESQGCPACTVFQWNGGGEMSQTCAARGPHSSH
ncbi:hypothetical protein BGY98DRAFT_1052200, partial [Russula aff. rugulosa BPL654]